MRSLRSDFYKGISGRFGAIQFNLQKPHYFCPKQPKICKSDFNSFFPQECRGTPDSPHEPVMMESREGCIFMEITSATGPNAYDWSKKIVMALSVHDMSQVLFTLETGEECKLMHDPGAKTAQQGQTVKSLNISSPKGIKAGVLISASMKSGETEVRHMVPLSGYEAKELSVLFRHAIVSSLAW